MVQAYFTSLQCMQAFNMMRVVGLVSLLVLQGAFCTVSAVRTSAPFAQHLAAHKSDVAIHAG